MRRKKDEPEPQHTDPDFIFYVGRLVGAAEFASTWLMLQQDNKQAMELGIALANTASWFVPQTKSKSDKPDVSYTAPTNVIPPQPIK